MYRLKNHRVLSAILIAFLAFGLTKLGVGDLTIATEIVRSTLEDSSS